MAEETVRPHTKIGMCASLLGVFACFTEMASLVAVQISTSEKKEDTLAIVGGTGMIVGLGLAAVGGFLAFLTFFFPSRRKMYGVIGFLLNGLIILAYVAVRFGAVLQRHGR